MHLISTMGLSYSIHMCQVPFSNVFPMTIDLFSSNGSQFLTIGSCEDFMFSKKVRTVDLSINGRDSSSAGLAHAQIKLSNEQNRYNDQLSHNRLIGRGR